MATVPINYNDSTNEFELINDRNGIIKCKFLIWSNNKATKLEITHNSRLNFQILRVDFVASSSCDGQIQSCNELHIKAQFGTSNTGYFNIQNGACDLNMTQIYTLKYTDSEIQNSNQLNMLCRICYSSGLAPTVKDGNVLQGI